MRLDKMTQINGKDETPTKNLSLALQTIEKSTKNAGITIDKLIELIDKEKEKIDV